MQIHELNNFSGTPGASDYFATDNGTDTSKISATDLYAPLNARINNIIAGPASSAEEVIDARLGANGVTYSSLGDAIRGQVADLKSDFGDVYGKVQKNPSYTSGGYIDKATGAVISYNGWEYTDYIDISTVKNISINASITGVNATYNCICDGQKVVIQNITADGNSVSVPSGAKYLRLSKQTSATFNVVFDYGSLQIVKNTLDDIESDIYIRSNNLFDIKETIENKSYNPSNNKFTSDASWAVTNLIDVSDWDGSSELWAKAYNFSDYSTGYRAIVYCYDSSKTYVGDADTDTSAATSFSAEPYRCKVFRLLSGTKYIRFQIYTSVLNENLSLMYSNKWSDEYHPYYVVDNDLHITDYAFLNKQQGIDVHHSVNALNLLTCAFNSAELNKAAYINRAKLYPTRFSHDGTLAIANDGTGYIAYVTNANGTGDSPTYDDAEVTLSSVDLATLNTASVFTDYDVAKKGDSVGSKTIISGAGVPNCVLDGNDLIILFSAKLSDGKWYLLRRVFDIDSKTFGSTSICKLTANGTTSDFTTEKINADIISLSSTDYFISMNAQIAKSGSVYCSGVCVGNYIPCGFIVSSSDLLNFELFNVPSVDGCYANFECACYIKDGYIYYAIRQNSGFKMYVCKINISSKQIVDTVVIDDAMSRPCWFEYDNKLYLVHSINGRESTEFIVVDTNSLGRSYAVMQSTIELIYPSIALYGSDVFAIATGNSSVAIYARKLQMPKYTSDKISSYLIAVAKDLFES